MWICSILEDAYHIIPVDDFREHTFIDCWCDPEIEYHVGGVLVIHNSMDGREKFETKERLAS